VTARAIIAHARASSQDAMAAKWLFVCKETGRVVALSRRRKRPRVSFSRLIVVPARAL
jgi:hypothetical protein